MAAINGVLHKDAAVPEEIPLLPLPPHDTRIFIGESKEETGALSHPAVPSNGVAGLGSAAAAPGDNNTPEDGSRGLLKGVDPTDTNEILRFRGLVDTRLHEAAREQDLPALHQLLDEGASASALDSEGRTPLHLCVEYRLMEPLEVLLGAPGAADVRDASGWPLLHAALLHDWKEGTHAILAACPDVTTFHSSCSRCKTGPKKPKGFQQDEFQKYVLDLPLSIAILKSDMEMFEAILTVAERNSAIDCRDGCGDTALCIAIVTSNLPAVQKLLTKEASLYRLNARNQSALHLAVRHPMILKYLLDKTNVTSSLDIEGLAPEHIAVMCGLNPMQLLLDKFSNTRIKTEPQGYTPLHYAMERGDEAAAELIIERDLGAIDVVDNQGDTPLLVAVKHNNRDLAKLLLRKGAQLSTTDKSGTTVLRLISSNFYKASRFLVHVFDKCIFYKGVCNTNALLVNVDYRVLTDGKELSQINMLEELVSCGHSKILLHPLIESLVHLKWSHFLPIFYTMIGVYTIFLFSSTILMTSSFYYEDAFRKTMKNSSVIHTTPSNNGTTSGSVGSHGGGYWLLVVLTYISTFILLLQESLFMNLRRRRYFTSMESWVKLIGLVLCAATPPLTALVAGPWPRHAASVALLLTWIQAMFLVSRLPRCGYYVLMFGKAISNMLKIFMTAIFLLIASALCFMTEYHSEAPFDGPIDAFVKTLVMMIPEIDFESLLGVNREALRDTRYFVLILFVIFVIFVPTIFMNFMYAVAVSDVNDLNETGSIRRLEKQVELLSTFDPLVYDGAIGKWLKNMFVDKRYHESMYTVKANQSTWKVRCWPHPYQPAFQKKCFSVSSLYSCKNPDCENYVETPMSPESLNSDLIYSIKIHPPELYNAIVGIANKCEDQLQRTMNNKSVNNYRCKIDALYDAIVDSDDDESGEDTDTDEYTRSDSDITLKKQMKSIINDMSKVEKENKDMKRAMEKINLKINNLSEISSDISRSIGVPNWTSLSRLTRRPRRRARRPRAQDRTSSIFKTFQSSSHSNGRTL